jgi:hypothetical protein
MGLFRHGKREMKTADGIVKKDNNIRGFKEVSDVAL